MSFRQVNVTGTTGETEAQDTLEQVEIVCKQRLGTVLVAADTPFQNNEQDSEIIRVLLPGGEHEMIAYMHLRGGEPAYLCIELDGDEFDVKVLRNDTTVYAEGEAR